MLVESLLEPYWLCMGIDPSLCGSTVGGIIPSRILPCEVCERIFQIIDDALLKRRSRLDYAGWFVSSDPRLEELKPE